MPQPHTTILSHDEAVTVAVTPAHVFEQFGPMPRSWVTAGHVASMTPAELRVAIVLAVHANTSGECWPSTRTIQQLAGLEHGAVFAALNRLEARRLIERLKRPGKLTTYRLLDARPVHTRGPVHAGGPVHPRGPHPSTRMDTTRPPRWTQTDHVQPLNIEQTSERRDEEEQIRRQQQADAELMLALTPEQRQAYREQYEATLPADVQPLSRRLPMSAASITSNIAALARRTSERPLCT